MTLIDKGVELYHCLQFCKRGGCNSECTRYKDRIINHFECKKILYSEISEWMSDAIDILEEN